MSKGPCTFRKSDYKAGCRSVEKRRSEGGSRRSRQGRQNHLLPQSSATDIAPANEWDAETDQCRGSN